LLFSLLVRYISNLEPGNEAHQEMRDSIREGKLLMETFLRNEARAREQLSLVDANRQTLV
jgi:hypothetical protein